MSHWLLDTYMLYKIAVSIGAFRVDRINMRIIAGVQFFGDNSSWFAIGFSEYGKLNPADYCIMWHDWHRETHFQVKYPLIWSIRPRANLQTILDPWAGYMGGQRRKDTSGLAARLWKFHVEETWQYHVLHILTQIGHLRRIWLHHRGGLNFSFRGSRNSRDHAQAERFFRVRSETILKFIKLRYIDKYPLLLWQIFKPIELHHTDKSSDFRGVLRMLHGSKVADRSSPWPASKSRMQKPRECLAWNCTECLIRSPCSRRTPGSSSCSLIRFKCRTKRPPTGVECKNCLKYWSESAYTR